MKYFHETDNFYSNRLCLVVIVINICSVVLIENMLVADISIPLLSDLQSRINTTSSFKTLSFLASFLVLRALYKHSGEIGISKSNTLFVGLLGETEMSG